jgi:cell division protein FtsL
MINLLPPSFKEQVRFAKHNAILIRYLKLAVLLIIVLGVSFGGTYYYLTRRIASTNAAMASKQEVIGSYTDIETQVKELNSRVAAIKTIQSSQPRFSLLLSDIAKFTLKGTAISSLALTGDDSKPVVISATAGSYTAAVSLRDALVASPRISGADIQSITGQSDGSFSVNIVIGFKPGQAR